MLNIHLVGVEAVVYKRADVVQVQGAHAVHPPGGFLEGRETDVEVDFVQVSAVKCVQLQERTRDFAVEVFTFGLIQEDSVGFFMF